MRVNCFGLDFGFDFDDIEFSDFLQFKFYYEYVLVSAWVVVG